MENSETSPAGATHKTSETYGDLCKMITSETKRIMPMTSNCIVALNLRSMATKNKGGVLNSDEPPGWVPTHESNEYYPASVGGTLFFISNFMSTGKHSSAAWTARNEQLIN